MVTYLSPVRGLKNGFTQIYYSHLKDQDGASKINRVWTAVFGILSLALGIAFMVSCSSQMTSSTHLVSVNTTQFILDITNNDPMLNNTNAARDALLEIFQQSQARIPDHYLFGLAGCCRVYTNNSQHCSKAFPQNPDILTTVVNDINAAASQTSGNNSSSINPASLVSPGFGPVQQYYNYTARIYTALITTCISWTLISIIFVTVFAHQSKMHLWITVPGVILAVGSAVLFTWSVVQQLSSYELGENYAAISFGPGSFLLWAWMACVMLLTPLTAMISVIVVSAIILVILWIAFLCAMIALACFCGALATSGQQNSNTEYGYAPGFGGDGGDGGGGDG